LRCRAHQETELHAPAGARLEPASILRGQEPSRVLSNQVFVHGFLPQSEHPHLSILPRYVTSSLTHGRRPPSLPQIARPLNGRPPPVAAMPAPAAPAGLARHARTVLPATVAQAARPAAQTASRQGEPAWHARPAPLAGARAARLARRSARVRADVGLCASSAPLGVPASRSSSIWLGVPASRSSCR